MSEPVLSIIIPVRNGGATITRCIEAANAARGSRSEVIVVDDGSTDDTADLAQRHPCTLVRLGRRAGAGAARNAGARKASGDHLFFIDADCLLLPDTIAAVRQAIAAHPGAVIGGTYTLLPDDRDFFSIFQSAFVHYHETRTSEPDYIASHAMVISAEAFRSTGGFPERFLPVIEDVELSHRLRRAGRRLVAAPAIQVRHIFRFSLRRSLANAFRKSRYWTVYSLYAGDALADSGTASRGLKMNVTMFAASVLTAIAGAVSSSAPLLAAALLPVAASAIANRGLLRAFWSVPRRLFCPFASLYYLLIYPAAVAAGALTGMLQYAVLPRPAGMEEARS